MKANAPEKIYLQVCGDCEDNDCKNCKFEDLEDNVTWCKDKIFDKDIEYTRTDVFVEKSVSYIQQHWIWNTKIIEDFKKYMKGE